MAFFPKCPVCWAGYLSVFGIAGLERIPYSPWLQPVLVAAMLINLASVWLRERSTGRMRGFYLAGAGALAIVVSKAGAGMGKVRCPGRRFDVGGFAVECAERQEESLGFSAGVVTRRVSPRRSRLPRCGAVSRAWETQGLALFFR